MAGLGFTVFFVISSNASTQAIAENHARESNGHKAALGSEHPKLLSFVAPRPRP